MTVQCSAKQKALVSICDKSLLSLTTHVVCSVFVYVFCFFFFLFIAILYMYILMSPSAKLITRHHTTINHLMSGSIKILQLYKFIIHPKTNTNRANIL